MVKEHSATLDEAGAASDVVPKSVSPSDPGGAVDRARCMASVFRLLRQLSPSTRSFASSLTWRHPAPFASRGFARRGLCSSERRAASASFSRVAPGRYRLRDGFEANWLVEEKGIALAYRRSIDKPQRRRWHFSRSDFRYDPASDIYLCPGGKQPVDERMHGAR